MVRRGAALGLFAAVAAAASAPDLVSRIARSPAILAPLTRAGTAPFRALCTAHGCRATMGEMAFARFVNRGDRREVARTRRHEDEVLFGAQIATKQIAEGVAACEAAAANGADWVDLNCGCPIHEATRRGLGSSLLRKKPEKLARLVAGIVDGSPVPVSVKLRTSADGAEDESYLGHVEALAGLGASAPAFATLHGRTARQRYAKPADWAAVAAAAAAGGASLPVFGNGDVLTHYEASARAAAAPAAAGLMIGRGALVSPWLFDEIEAGASWLPSPRERVGVYADLAAKYRSHFGDDARGRSMAAYFLPFHFSWFHRYRPLPEASFGGLDAPLIQSGRDIRAALLDIEGPADGLPPLERLLRSPNERAHSALADALWDSPTSADAAAALASLATPENLAAWADATTADDDAEGTGATRPPRAAGPPKKGRPKRPPSPWAPTSGRKPNGSQLAPSLQTRTFCLYQPRKRPVQAS